MFVRSTCKQPFKDPPAVNVTVYDVTGRHLMPILLDVKTDRFTVKIVRKMTIQHVHKIGDSNTSTSASTPAIVPLRMNTAPNLGSQNKTVIGMLTATDTGVPSKELWSDWYQPTGWQSGPSPDEQTGINEVPMGADFHWIAIPRTQNPGYHP